MGIVGFTSLIRSLASCFQVLPVDFFTTVLIVFGMSFEMWSPPRVCEYPSIMHSKIFAVVTPGKSDPRDAVASESARRMRS